MTKRYSICWSDDELTFQAPDDAPSLSVRNEGHRGRSDSCLAALCCARPAGQGAFPSGERQFGHLSACLPGFRRQGRACVDGGRQQFPHHVQRRGRPVWLLGDPSQNRSKLRWAGHVFALLTLRGAKARRPTCLPLQTVTIFCRCLRRWQRWRCSAEGLFPAWALRADNCSVPIRPSLHPPVHLPNCSCLLPIIWLIANCGGGDGYG